MRFVVIYDACVLYPAPLRDFLIRLARTGLFAAKWTDDFLEALHPDVFAEQQLDLGESAVLWAAKEHRAALRNPEVGPDAYIDTLEKHGLAVTAQRLREFSEFI
ncbi:hypothetical protein [Thioalkalivibrio sp. ALR17-21]|uniref:hypothetical protein n=1 Tax=Thioalkalivibrio sp. ALR17-21 TaxID=1269813 RepID=UPI0003FF4517|nr:hypothetical protein [Thioalkalivibrio sp. ALR17-21]